MPNVLVRGHMRFEVDSDSDSDSDSVGTKDRKRFLEERIRALEDEVWALRKELDDSIRAEARWKKENESLKRKALTIENHRAKKDNLANAAERFEREIAEAARCRGVDSCSGGWVRVNLQTEDETVAEVRQQLLETMATAQCLYPNINLERIFRK